MEDAGAWLGERKTARFERVQVAVPAATFAPSTLVVHGPRGLRIEGLDVAASAAATSKSSTDSTKRAKK